MEIRDHLLPLVRNRGALSPQAGPVRLIIRILGSGILSIGLRSTRCGAIKQLPQGIGTP